MILPKHIHKTIWNLTLRYAIIGSVVVAVGNDYNDWSEYDSDNEDDLLDNDSNSTDNDNIYEEMLKIATLRNNRYDKWKKKDVSLDNNIPTVNYDKEKREIISIPSLFFNTTSRSYTLKIVDNKRISTLKSLTPKRSTPTIHQPIDK